MTTPLPNTLILVDISQINQIIASAVAESFAAQVNAKLQSEENTAEKLLTYQETCDLLSITRSALFKWVKKGAITPRYLGSSSKPYFKYSEVMNALQAKAKPKLPI